MEKTVARINGWEVRQRVDGSYAVYDEHGFMDGPFGHADEAVAAAKRLPAVAVKPPARSAWGWSATQRQ